ncbi:unnamed protein product [Ceutorhynchus assimilis]|uniref:Uncharacterized protein n=1 Tax=Ceutorhynchus assimilis TaxID=467358 RepID=A0A9N9MXB7_9CUCU|nr:unnamed protein product [Ceutorhynchus assimilis]
MEIDTVETRKSPKTSSEISFATMIDIDQPGPSRCQLLSTETSAIRADIATPSGTITFANMKKSPTLSLKTFIGHERRCQILKNINVTRQKFLFPREKYLYSKVIESSNKLSRISRRLSSFKSKVSSAE